jgi:putative ABC transport system substrate-binding protein
MRQTARLRALPAGGMIDFLQPRGGYPVVSLGRREFVGLLGGAAAWPVVARAQQALVGFLHSGSQQEWGYAVAAFQAGLKEAGYVAGQNLRIEYRWAQDQYDRLPALAADLAGLNPSVMFASGGSIAALAAKRATSTIPVVFAIGADPVKMGLVGALNRPGGNVTGVTFLLNALVAKRLEFLRELVPAAGAIGILVNPTNPNAQSDVKDVQDAARVLGLRTHVGNIRSENEIEVAFEQLHREGVGAFILLPDPNFISRRDQIVALAARHSLPGMYFIREFAVGGGLMTYSASLTEAQRLAAGYVGRILNGANPADLPVLQPTKYELVINLKTAKALGLDVPLQLQQLADEVIE